MDEQRCIGRIERVSPGNRTIRITLATSYIAYALTLVVLRCEGKDGSILRCRVQASKPSKDGLIVTVVAGVPRDTIAQLKNNKLVVPAGDIVRDTQHYDAKELVGLNVCTPDAQLVGTIQAAFETKANGMAEVQLTQGAMVLLPLVPELIDRVDWTSNTVHLHSDAPIQATMHDDHDDTVLT